MVARSRREILLAAAAIGVAMGVALYFPDRDDGSGAVFGGIFAFIAAAVGLAAVTAVRPLERRSVADHGRIAMLSLGLGVALGLANLAANFTMAMLDPAIHASMVERWADFSSWPIVVSEPIMEELVFRLLLMGGTAWLTSTFIKNPRTIFLVALGVSALAFGTVHIFYGGIEGALYSTGTVLKAAAAGLLLGWVFWRWGLPYSIACHSAANAIHLVLIPVVF